MAQPLDQALQQLQLDTHCRFSPAQIDALQQATGLGQDELALALLPLAQQKALVPVSHFRVGALAIADSGHWYLGANLEVDGLPLNHSLHAEQSAIGHAALWGERRIDKVVVTASPCGHCRQFMNELNQDSLAIVLPQTRQSLAELLPHAFGPADLGIDGGMLNAPAGSLAFDTEDPLLLAALAEANASYAPYSQNRAGVALLLDDGRVCRGRYLENAAFNPSLSPMQLALSQVLLQGATPARIRQAVMVEAEAGIRQHDTAAQTLARLSPVALYSLVI
ncbi:cytidine deaminase [Zobellella denitrificans]|uniref:cytidine deaminase n=1 Tax=Zobellella denitrificans TaxID=347534 RepID=UPI000B8C18D0|nr:cytidine deaminase [Zobellella denitrificans]OXS16572.1 cytidine deaminase [Zobellella denitrificans]